MKTGLALVAVALVLAGCSGGGATCTSNCTPIGGGSGGSGSGGGGVTTPTVSVAMSSQTVTSVTPATVTATVTDASGNAVAGTVVTFTVDATIGLLSATSALTNSSGVATVTLSPAAGASATAADTVTASATVSGTTVTASTGYQLSTTSAAFTNFVANDLPTSGKLAPYTQTTMTATMTGVSSTSPATVSITSECVILGKATISPAQQIVTSGTVNFVYKDIGGCGATKAADNVTVTAASSSAPTATLQLPLDAPAAASITFVDPSANGTPIQIYLKGSGFTESANVVFKVVDKAGNPLPNQTVSMALTTYAGGILLNGGQTTTSSVTNTDGEVTAIVNAGTVPTPVRVKAALGSDINGPINTVSSSLSIGTGLPTELGFSLSEDTINMEGYDYDNSWNSFSISAADRSGNPVHDSTTVTFWAESGQIPTFAGTTTTGGLSIVTVNYGSQQSNKPLDGHVTVAAYALGEESFSDLNGNNVWDAGEPFMDLGDVVKDVLNDNNYDVNGGDQYVSLLGTQHGGSAACVDGSGSNPLFALTPNTPSEPGTCDGTWTSKVYVRRAIETVLSRSTANPIWVISPSSDPFGAIKSSLPNAGGCGTSISRQLGSSASSAQVMYPVGLNPTIYVGRGVLSEGHVTMLAADSNPVRLNPMPAGTIASGFISGSALAVNGINGTPIANTDTATIVSVPWFVGAVGGRESIDLSLTTLGPKLPPDGHRNTNSGTTTTVTITIVRDDPPAGC